MRAPLVLLSFGVLAWAQSAEVQGLIDASKAQMDQQRYSEAAALAEQAVELSRASADKKGETQALLRLSSVDFYWRKLAAAVDTANRAMATAREAGDEAAYAKALGLAADGLRDQGKLEEARQDYEQQLRYFRGAGDRKSEAVNLRMTAILYRTMGDSARAADLIEKSLAIARELKDPSMEGPALFILGVLANEQQHYEAAIEHYNAALQMPGINEFTKGQILQGLGTAYCNLGKYERCIEIDRQQLESAMAAGNPLQIAWGYFKLAYPQTLSGDKEGAYESTVKALAHLRSTDHDPYDEWHFVAAVGQRLADLHRDREAIPYYREAIAIVERLRQGLVPTEEGMAKAASAGFTKTLFDEAIALLYGQSPAEAFEVVELARARAFLSILAESKIDLRQGLSSSQRQQEKELFAKIAEATRTKKTADVDAAEAGLESLRLEIRRSNPRLAAIQYPKPLTLAQVQKDVLKPGVTLVEYSLGAQRSFVWAVSCDRVLSAALPPAAEIEKLVTAFRKSTSASVSSLTLSKAEDESAAISGQLYRVLVQPVEAMLADSQSLIVIPDGVLYYVPFEALSPPGRSAFLLERFPVSYAPSATSLTAVDAPSSPSKQLLAFGDPLYTQRVPLPNTREEVNGIAALFPKDQRTVYVGAAARAETVKTEPIDGYRYIHFAAHGILDEQHPARSGLALSKDSILEVNEITDLRLHADLVTLSACSTGLGELVSGEGMLGLVRAFLYAGAGSVAVSLWNVNDAATADLMKEFYRGLSRGQPAGEALRQAKLGLLHRSDTPWRHPHYWAAFVLWLR
ncbi:MAG TPA: CHAT domain-containing tetratricopeptide repeat protein [Bryobacteraceae bacterium]|nr:CHAT domain-containing tetratricopeptide repeat protein [Bryobacteraceae bacterium]